MKDRRGREWSPVERSQDRSSLKLTFSGRDRTKESFFSRGQFRFSPFFLFFFSLQISLILAGEKFSPIRVDRSNRERGNDRKSRRKKGRRKAVLKGPSCLFFPKTSFFLSLSQTLSFVLFRLHRPRLDK